MVDPCKSLWSRSPAPVDTSLLWALAAWVISSSWHSEGHLADIHGLYGKKWQETGKPIGFIGCFKCVLAPRKGNSWRHKNMNRSGVEGLGVFSQNIFGLVANEIKESLPAMAHGLHRTSVCWTRHIHCIHLFFGHNPKDCYPISPQISHSFTYTLTSL